jgi:hypothetical protein
MPAFRLQKGMFTVQFITGPSSLSLRLAIGSMRPESLDVILLQRDSHYGNVNEAEAGACVLAGTDEANRECGTAFHPLAAEYVADNDAKGRLLRWAAYSIVKRLAERGESGFPGT